MKCAKLIACYFGDRRSDNANPKNPFSFIKEMILNELSLENGYPTDVYLIVNNCDNLSSDNFLSKYNNIKTKNGTLKVINRENIGGSFGAYLDTYSKYQNKYKYWFFCEDDVFIYKNNYIKVFIDYLEQNKENVSFVSLSPISQNHPIHCGGGCGLTSTDIMKEYYSKETIDKFFENYKLNGSSYSVLSNYETQFSSQFCIKDKTLSNCPDYSPLCINYNDHSNQKRYYFLNDEKNPKEFIYSVGSTSQIPLI